MAAREQIDRYRDIAAQGEKALRGGSVELDRILLKPEEDHRFGLSLVLHPEPTLAQEYTELVAQCRSVEPHQYYYPFGDLHVTVFDLVAAYEGFNRRGIDLEAYLELSREAIAGGNAFDIDFSSVIFSEAAGIVAGLDSGELVEIRENIRNALTKRGLPNTERYEAVTAHMTFCRFIRPLSNYAAMSEIAQGLVQHRLGTTHVFNFELVVHDWYNRGMSRELISAIGFD